MRILLHHLQAIVATLFLLFPASVWGADIDPFVGVFSGHAEVALAGESQPRELRATIEPTSDGFAVSWASVTYKADSGSKTKSYSVEFVPSQRDHIYGSAMKSNIFGKQVPLDPLRGEPFVWSRFQGDTFSVFSLFINEAGEYEMQEYHRTLAEGGLDLVFRSVRNGSPQKEITAFLARQP